MATIRHGRATPNQRSKQQQIVAAAREVLATSGLAGCTARAVADAGPLTKSAVHYYFRDIDDLVDVAMGQHLDALLTRLRRRSEDEPDPERRLWLFVEDYLDYFAGAPHAALLWFEYWIALHRRADPGPARRDLDAIRALLRDLLAGTGQPHPDATADTVLSWLLGAVVQQSVDPRPAGDRRREFERLLRGAGPETR